LNFYDFFYIMESTFGGEDPLSMNVDDVQLRGGGGRLSYTFEMDGENYTVNFSRVSVYMDGPGGGQDITRNAYSITLQGPNGYQLTGRGKAMTVYKSLIKAVVKLIKQENPEGLQFYGALPEQDIMYANFYEKFLHKVYTRVTRKDYLNNQFIEQLKTSGDPRWAVVEKGIEAEKSSNDIEQKRQAKAQKRERRQQLAGQLATYRGAMNKIAWFKGDGNYRAMPVLLSNINADNGEITFYYVYGSYLESASTEQYDKFVPIDQMPNDPAQIKALQKLVKKYKSRNGGEPQFWGTPPVEMSVEQEHPLQQAINKIAFQESYGPVFIRRVNDDDDTVRFRYVQSGALSDDDADASSFQPIDQMPNDDPRFLKRLRKLVKVLQDEGIPVQFWGNPPAELGDEDDDPYAGIENKIAYSQSYGPVFITHYNDEESEVSFYYMGRSHLDSGYTSINRIEKIDSLPDDQDHLKALAKFVRKLHRDGAVHRNEIEFWGTPPQGWDNIQRQTQEFEGKIAWTNDYGPVWVLPHDGNTDDEEYRVYYLYGNGLNWHEIQESRIRPINSLPRNYIRKLKRLIQALQDEETIQEPQFYGEPPAGWDQEEQRHPAIGKIAYSANYGPIWVHDDDDNGFDDEFSVTYVNSIGRVGTMQLDGHNIKPIDEMPQSQAQKLQTIVQQVERGRGQHPGFYGNPPAWSAAVDPRQAVGKIVYSDYYELAFYVKNFNGRFANSLFLTSQDELRAHELPSEYIKPLEQIPQPHQQSAMQKIQALQQALQQQQGIQAQAWRGA